MIPGRKIEVVLPLTRAEARALLALALEGRVLLDVDRAFLGRPDRRDAGRRAVGRLRRQVETMPCRVGKAEPSDHGEPERAPA